MFISSSQSNIQNRGKDEPSNPIIHWCAQQRTYSLVKPLKMFWNLRDANYLWMQFPWNKFNVFRGRKSLSTRLTWTRRMKCWFQLHISTRKSSGHSEFRFCSRSVRCVSGVLMSACVGGRLSSVRFVYVMLFNVWIYCGRGNPSEKWWREFRACLTFRRKSLRR